jgi:hypothetical protein
MLRRRALFGRAFYFTEDRDVARGYAEIRHLPAVEAFDDRAALDAFLADHPDWEAAYVERSAAAWWSSSATPSIARR